MKTGQLKRKGHPITPLFSVAIGLSVSIIMTILLSAIAAWLVSGERLPQSAITRATIPIQLIAAFFGCITAMIIGRKMPAVIASAYAASYFAILICTNILVLDSSFGGVGKGILAILGGAIAAVLIMLFVNRNGKRKKVRIR